MNFLDLPRDPARAFAHPILAGVRLVFRSNVAEPVLVTLDALDGVEAERPDRDIGDVLPEGWEEVEPLPATGIVHDEFFQDTPDQPIGDP